MPDSDTRHVGQLHRFLSDFATADLDEGAADAVTVGMVYQQEVERVWLPRIARLEDALETLRREALLHLNNSIGCAINHYGDDHQEHGLPQWIADSQLRIRDALSGLAPVVPSDPMPNPTPYRAIVGGQ